jgi:hypothetical protein
MDISDGFHGVRMVVAAGGIKNWLVFEQPTSAILSSLPVDFLIFNDVLDYMLHYLTFVTHRVCWLVTVQKKEQYYEPANE